jgi:hypothetical protein
VELANKQSQTWHKSGFGKKELEVCTDVVRFGYVNKPSGDVAIWIGVMPDSLSYEVGIDAAFDCKRLLLDNGINDVEVEIRQSEVTRSAGPQLFQPTYNVDPTVDVREPLTPTLGIPHLCSIHALGRRHRWLLPRRWRRRQEASPSYRSPRGLSPIRQRTHRAQVRESAPP